MKLNLLPTTVSKGKQAKSGIVLSLLIALAGAGAAIFVSTSSAKALNDAKAAYEDSKGPAEAAYSKSTEADAILNADSSVALIRDASLAEAMIKHNDVYPDLYESVRPYVPSFYRVNSMYATPTGAGSSTITLVGTLKTYQQYADLMLAFSRYPGVVSVGRAGYQFNDNIVPNLTPGDQTGTPHKPSEAPVPDDKLARLTYFESQVQPQGYTGAGNFGSGTDSTRGAMPDYSLVTVTLTVTKDLQVPLPRTTLTSAGGGAASSAMTAGGPPAGMGGPGGMMGGGPGMPGAGAGAGSASSSASDNAPVGKKGKADQSD
ncbi:MAG: hypothetical protein P4L46_20170 [Fimbriimonas sp.]|nr:hypothetical protein [Fimbriimonas sp.]